MLVVIPLSIDHLGVPVKLQGGKYLLPELYLQHLPIPVPLGKHARSVYSGHTPRAIEKGETKAPHCRTENMSDSCATADNGGDEQKA